MPNSSNVSALKVLGIAGSPRRGGNTDLLLAEVLRGAESNGAAIKTIILCNLKYIPCTHCDACQKTGNCKFQDDMQMVYQELAGADRIVLASPIQFLTVTAHMKAMIDRCQAMWSRKFILNSPPLSPVKKRKGLFVAVGGRMQANLFEPAQATIRIFFKTLDIQYVGDVLFRGIDVKGEIARHPDAMQQAFLAGQKLIEDC